MRRRAAKNLTAVAGWSQGHISAGCCGVLTRAEQLWIGGMHWGCHSSTSPYKFCCPSTGCPLQFTSRAQESSGGIFPV